LRGPQKAAANALGPGATNAEISAARSAVRSGINADANAVYNSATQSIGRNTGIIQGGVGAAGTKSGSEANKSIMTKISNWWNDN